MTYTTDTPCNVTLPYGDSSREPIHVSPLGQDGDLLMEMPSNLIWQIGYLGQGSRSYASGREDTPKNELLAFAHASLSVNNHRSRGYSHPEDDLRIDNVTKCVISSCSREHNARMSGGIVSIDLSKPDWDEIFTHQYSLREGMSPNSDETVCWKPGHGGSENVTLVSGTWTVWVMCLQMQVNSLFVQTLASTLKPRQPLPERHLKNRAGRDTRTPPTPCRHTWRMTTTLHQIP